MMAGGSCSLCNAVWLSTKRPRRGPQNTPKRPPRNLHDSNTVAGWTEGHCIIRRPLLAGVHGVLDVS
eukprot:6223495-Pyramimonas_sp.AAC.1